jgi:hypothetical protein
MCNRLWGAMILAGLLAWQTAVSRADELMRLPPVGPSTMGSEPVAASGSEPIQSTEGTWREDGQHVIINLDGREIRLAKSTSGQESNRVPNQNESTGGTVYGRLLNKGRALVRCQVVVVPLHMDKGVYCFDPQRQVINTTTDEEGVYRFENVPAGGYKLTWLPEGQDRWIRRIAMSPDITVRSGETTKAKEIRIAMQTIN